MIGFIRRKKNESVLGRNRREKTFQNYDSIRNVLILFNTADLAEVAVAVEALRKDGKTVSAWTTRPKEKEFSVNYPPYVRAIDLGKEISWTQTLEKTVIQEFEKLTYDTFLDLTTADDTILDYLLAANSSRFCIGIREHNFKAHDFIMLKQEGQSIPETCEQLKYYLQRIMA
ncbi:MAG: hypothetical protein LBR34_06650 [Prevotella sp.]|jgi:hypothetical protein|nr:hypothetical protein [Prevotella sp.]